MKILFRVVLFSMVLLFGTSVALLAGERNGHALVDLSTVPVEMVAKSPATDTLYATSSGENSGIFRSSDNGRSWLRVGDGPALNVKTITTHPANKERLFAGSAGGSILAGDASIWYSDDEGRTWNEYGFSLPANPQGELPHVSAMLVDPNHPGVIYVGTQGAGLFRLQSAGYSRIGGASLAGLFVKDVVVAPDSPIYVVTTEGLIVVEGDSWRNIDTLPDAAVSLAIDPQDPRTLYVGTVGYGVHRSGDGGQSWQPLNQGLGLQPGVILRIPAIAVDEANPQHLALATAFSVGRHLVGDGVYESLDGGESWIKLGENPELVNSLTIEDGGIFAATSKGLVRYGAPLSPHSADTLQSRVNGLTTPTGVQSLILVLTAAVSAWMLVGRLNWLREESGRPLGL